LLYHFQRFKIDFHWAVKRRGNALQCHVVKCWSQAACGDYELWVAGFGLVDGGGDFWDIVLDYRYASDGGAELSSFYSKPVGVGVLDFANE
jgi:hypothetical protein